MKTRSLRHAMAAHESWAQTQDRTARTAPGRRAADARFLKLAGGDVKRAQSLRQAHYLRMHQKSLAVRLAQKAARDTP